MYTLLYFKWVTNKDLLYSPGTVARQAPLSMGFSRQEYWSGLPCPPQRDLPHPGIKPRSPALRANSLPFELPQEAHSTGNFAQCYVLAWMGGWLGENGSCICMAESLHCSLETTTTLLVGYTPTQN